MAESANDELGVGCEHGWVLFGMIQVHLRDIGACALCKLVGKIGFEIPQRSDGARELVGKTRFDRIHRGLQAAGIVVQ